MRRIIAISVLPMALAAMTVTPAMAQDAAESAAILSGTGARTGAAAGRLGTASRDALGGAAGVIAATNSQRSGSQSARQSRRSNGGANSDGGVAAGLYVAGNIDALQLTDAPFFRLADGSILRMSGSFVPSPGTTCERNCRS
ncbi:MAG: hypothetical protein KDE15_10430 [Erythrobacter sp.]|nr:hypothetical protein [Erythrobacter sp.]